MLSWIQDAAVTYLNQTPYPIELGVVAHRVCLFLPHTVEKNMGDQVRHRPSRDCGIYKEGEIIDCTITLFTETGRSMIGGMTFAGSAGSPHRSECDSKPHSFFSGQTSVPAYHDLTSFPAVTCAVSVIHPPPKS